MSTQFDSQPYLALALAFEGAMPAGDDVSVSEDFEAINEELSKAEGVNIKAVNWNTVETLSVNILANQSKDLKVAAYLTIALYEQHGFVGLAAGLDVFADMVNADYWPDLHPKRKAKRQNKARAACFGWAVFRIGRIVGSLEVTQDSDFEHLLAAAKAFEQADGALYQRLEGDAPDCADVRNRFKRIAQEAKAWIDEAKSQSEPAPEPEPEVEIAKPSIAQRVTDKTKEVVQTVKEAFVPPSEAVICASKGDIDKTLNFSRKSIESVVTALRNDAEYDPMSFYLSRTAGWMGVDELPPDGIMPANPTEQQFADLDTMMNNQHYAALVEQGEKLFAQGAIFNFALHRLIANALDGAGAIECSHMVKICVVHMLQRLPGLMGLKFNNDQPFVDDLTKNWLDHSSVNMGNSDGCKNNTSQQPVIDGTNNHASWLNGSNEASQRLSQGDFAGGIEVFAQGIAAASSLRERTFWQLAQARFCDTANHLDLALSQLQYLEEFVKDNVLAQWEPQLRIDIISELLKCHVKKMAKLTYTTEQKQALTPLYNELSLKDPVVALSISIN